MSQGPMGPFRSALPLRRMDVPYLGFGPWQCHLFGQSCLLLGEKQMALFWPSDQIGRQPKGKKSVALSMVLKK